MSSNTYIVIFPQEPADVPDADAERRANYLARQLSTIMHQPTVVIPHRRDDVKPPSGTASHVVKDDGRYVLQNNPDASLD